MKTQTELQLTNPMKLVLAALAKLNKPATRTQVNKFTYAKTDNPKRRISDMAGTYAALCKLKLVNADKKANPVTYAITTEGKAAIKAAK